MSNAAAVKFWCDLLGPQDEINPVRDPTLPMIAAMRQVTEHPLDIHVFHRGTVARTMETPEIVRIASPVYLKNAKSGPGKRIEDRLMQAFRVIDTIRSSSHRRFSPNQQRRASLFQRIPKRQLEPVFIRAAQPVIRTCRTCADLASTFDQR